MTNRFKLCRTVPYALLILTLFLCAGRGMTVRCLAEARWPVSGGATAGDGKLLLDTANISEGYFLAGSSEATSHVLKLRVEKDGMTLTYDLDQNGNFEVFPLQLGSGDYLVTLYENAGGKKYAQAGTLVLSVALSDENVPFLYPNQYVHYTELSPIVEEAASLCEGKSPADAWKTVCDFMQSSFVYDYVKALTVQAGTLPDIDGAFELKMGICQDLSAIMVGMLRTRDVPARLIIGYADDNYHAWTETSVDGEDQFFDPTAALNAIAPPETYTVERYY